MSISDPKTLQIAVIMGGPSAEADVSRSSGKEVSKALLDSGYQVQGIELNQQLTSKLLALQPDVVFPALHGPVGEDGTIQGYLEIMGLPYVGSDVRGSAMAMDKCVAKSIFRSAALPVAAEVMITANDDQQQLAAQIRQLGPQVVIKPRAEGSAIGVMRLSDLAQLDDALETAMGWTHGALAEPFIHGREVTVGVLDLYAQTPQTMPAIQIETASGQWYDFSNRYAAGKSEHLIPAPLPTAVLEELQRTALVAHQSLGLRDLSRSDFLVDDTDRIILLETNTLPGMTPTSLYPDGAAALGYDFPQLMHALVQSALRRGRTQ
ncbi:MAG: D-alanine--D-alanine ligase family protein [Pseudomonadales bacterium]